RGRRLRLQGPAEPAGARRRAAAAGGRTTPGSRGMTGRMAFAGPPHPGPAPGPPAGAPVASSPVGDEKASAEEVKRRKVTVKGNVLIYDHGNEQKEKQEGTVRLDPKAKHLDWTWTSPASGTTLLALYELTGDDLKIGFGNDGQ